MRLISAPVMVTNILYFIKTKKPFLGGLIAKKTHGKFLVSN